MTVSKPLAILLCTLPWAAALACLSWFISVRYPAAVFTADAHFDSKSAWADPFLPGERTSKPGLQQDGWNGQRIIGDPVYFTARVPGLYETVDVGLEFRPVHQTLIEFGMVHDAAGTDLELRPLYDDELMDPSWKPAVTQSAPSGVQAVGYVRGGADPSRLAVSDPRGMAVWYASSSYPALSDPMQPTSTVYDISLRGSHDMYAVPADGRISATFTLQAVNRKVGTDIVVIRVFKGDREISREAFDANGSLDKRMDKSFEHVLDLFDLDPGVYRIALVAQDDVFIRRIETNVRHLVFGPRFVLGDTSGYLAAPVPVTVWTNSRHVVAETFHADALQSVSLATSTVILRQTHTSYSLDRRDAASVAKLYVPKGNVRFVGDGFFALSPDAFFEPRPRRLGDTTRLAEEGIDVVRTPFTRPEPMGDGWYVAHQRFALDPSVSVSRFVLSAPGIDARAGAVDVRAVHLTYERTPAYGLEWFKLIAKEFVHALRRL